MASSFEKYLIEQSGRTGEPGMDPEVTVTAEGHLQIRQTFSKMSDAFQAVSLAAEDLRRWLGYDGTEGVRAVRLEDWKRASGE
ncbi:hypothetical protein ABZV65_30565 [Streptomyces bauhiniae]|uniref:hypothetical protein n=1 Tax=Streptomyces bauhiniae TaxID=2340725 RepID=UPI0033B9FA74